MYVPVIPCVCRRVDGPSFDPPHSQKQTEFARIAYATSVGFLIMGFIGFFVKLIHIPINNILLGGF